MKTYPTTTTSTDFHDWSYEEFSKREDAMDTLISERINDLETMKPSYAAEFMQEVSEFIAMSDKEELINRWLFQVWQFRNARADSTGKKMRDFATSQIAELLNDAIITCITKQVEAEYR